MWHYRHSAKKTPSKNACLFQVEFMVPGASFSKFSSCAGILNQKFPQDINLYSESGTYLISKAQFATNLWQISGGN